MLSPARTEVLESPQKEDHLTIAIWISCFQSVFAWIYFHFHLRAPTCHFEIWSSWLMLPARKSCQWCWQSFFCQLISVPASPEQQSAVHSQPEGVTTSHWWFFICCGFHGVSCSSRSTPTSTWLMSFWCFLHRLLMFHASGFSARRGALSSLACSWFIDNICIEYQISCSFIHNQYFSMRQLFINHWWVTMNQTYTCFMADDFHVDRTGGNPVPNKAQDCLYYREQQLITGEDFMWFTWFFMLCFLSLSIHANKPILLGWILQATEQVGLWIINGSITGAINSWTSISEKIQLFQQILRPTESRLLMFSRYLWPPEKLTWVPWPRHRPVPGFLHLESRLGIRRSTWFSTTPILHIEHFINSSIRAKALRLGFAGSHPPMGVSAESMNHNQ